MYIGDYAVSAPDRAAVVMSDTGERVTYAQLFRRSNQLARYLRAAGLRRGDHYAIFAENHVGYFEAVWAGLNSGLYVTAVNSHLTAAEAAYIVRDSGSRVLVSTAALSETAEGMVPLTPAVDRRLSLDTAFGAYTGYDSAVGDFSGDRLEFESRGMFMLYSSGTTGQPKGVEFPLPEHPASDGDAQMLPSAGPMFRLGESSVYLSPAPLYHAAPLRVSAVAHCFGATVIVMPRFDAEAALAAIERYEVTSSQWVPTMFVRMLKLDPATRARYDISSLEVAVHAAAPCPVEVKQQMIDWWGPILFEYYSGTENIGTTALSSQEWLDHKGSVGRAHSGAMRICDDMGNELPVGEIGLVYFSMPESVVSYHDDGATTASMFHPFQPEWRTLGDVGYLDHDGFLYLTDRKAFMVISGGVNIYPQEVENALIMHPDVADVAVFGVPNPDLGEEVKAVVEPRDFDAATPMFAEELIAYCRAQLAAYKCPRTLDFVRALPRLENGKLYKKPLRDAYWTGAAAAPADESSS